MKTTGRQKTGLVLLGLTFLIPFGLGFALGDNSTKAILAIMLVLSVVGLWTCYAMYLILGDL